MCLQNVEHHFTFLKVNNIYYVGLRYRQLPCKCWVNHGFQKNGLMSSSSPAVLAIWWTHSLSLQLPTQPDKCSYGLQQLIFLAHILQSSEMTLKGFIWEDIKCLIHKIISEKSNHWCYCHPESSPGPGICEFNKKISSGPDSPSLLNCLGKDQELDVLIRQIFGK